MSATATVLRGGTAWTVPARPQRGADALLLMSEHVLYEIELVPGLLRALFFDGRTDGDRRDSSSIAFARGNAEIEALLMHSRALDDFFYADQVVHAPAARAARLRPGDPPPSLSLRDDDVLAIDFVKDAQLWLDRRPARPQALREGRRRINVTLAHLSWHRVPPSAVAGVDTTRKVQSWAHYELFDALKAVVEVFIDHVREEGLCNNFVARAREALARAYPSGADLEDMGNRDPSAPMRSDPR